jgi:hypothetical protein
MIEVVDNFLPSDVWHSLYRKLLMSDKGNPHTMVDDGIKWNYNPTISVNGDGSSSTGYFLHNLLFDINKSEMFDTIAKPVESALNLDHYKTLHRAKVNLYPRTRKVEPHGFHVDLIDDKGDTLDHVNCVYYVNSNDGYTEFEDGSRVASVENRIVIFDGHIKHRSTSCTNEPCRISINMNMLP